MSFLKRVLHLIFFLFFVIFYSCESKLDKSHGIKNFNKLKLTDRQLTDPKPGEWLFTHKEKGQSFDKYKKTKSIEVSNKSMLIYILPIGDFNDFENRLINSNVEYLEVFFGLKTKILPSIKDGLISDEYKRENGDIQQLNANYLINDFLIKNKPNDALVVLGITSKDIYPKPEWNYVFGLASYTKCTAVVSLFRISNGEDNKRNFILSLERLNKISSHEISHMFSLKHCINAVCLMNGTNNLNETDIKPNVLCSECLAKLSWKLDFKDFERLGQIKEYFYEYDFVEDFETIDRQLKAIK
jgi:archaemetzincin